jgi:hypothetical protein
MMEGEVTSVMAKEGGTGTLAGSINAIRTILKSANQKIKKIARDNKEAHI